MGRGHLTGSRGSFHDAFDGEISGFGFLGGARTSIIDSKNIDVGVNWSAPFAVGGWGAGARQGAVLHMTLPNGRWAHSAIAFLSWDVLRSSNTLEASVNEDLK